MKAAVCHRSSRLSQIPWCWVCCDYLPSRPTAVASTSTAGDPSTTPRFLLSIYTSDWKIDMLEATLPDAWQYKVTAGTGRPGVGILDKLQQQVWSQVPSQWGSANNNYLSRSALRFTLQGRWATKKQTLFQSRSESMTSSDVLLSGCLWLWGTGHYGRLNYRGRGRGDYETRNFRALRNQAQTHNKSWSLNDEVSA